MIFNFKKTAIASIILISGAVFAQAEVAKPLIPASAPVSAVKETPAVEVVTPKPVVKKIVKRKPVIKKVVPAPEINIISQNNIVPEPVYIAPIPEYYSYSDIVVSPQFIKQGNGGWFKKDSFKLVLNTKDLQGNNYPSENFVQTDGNIFKVVQISTDLKSSSQVDLNYNQVYEPLTPKEGCQVFFVQYKLKGNLNYKVDHFFLNDDGIVSSLLPAKCTLSKKEERDSIEYTARNYIADVSFTTQTSLSSKPFEFNMHLVRQGKDLFGNNLKAYIVDKNFDNIYFPEIIPHRKGPYFGTHFSHPALKSGSYNIVLSYDVEEGSEVTTVLRTVQ